MSAVSGLADRAEVAIREVELSQREVRQRHRRVVGEIVRRVVDDVVRGVGGIVDLVAGVDDASVDAARVRRMTRDVVDGTADARRRARGDAGAIDAVLRDVRDDA